MIYNFTNNFLHLKKQRKTEPNPGTLSPILFLSLVSLHSVDGESLMRLLHPTTATTN